MIYAVPADGADRELDLDGSLEVSVTVFNRWLREQTPGRSLRIDTFQGRPDISFYRSPKTSAELLAAGNQLSRVINEDLPAAGFADPDKRYAVYYDGPSVATPCGGAALPLRVPGQAAVMYLQSSCATPFAAEADDPMGYWEVAMLHDLVHTLGFVPTCAPNHGGPNNGGHVTDDPSDLMWAGAAPWLPNGFESAVLDVGNDDYYQPGIDGCRDLDRSAYLTTTAATTTRTVPLAPVRLRPGSSASATADVRRKFSVVVEVCFDLETLGDPPGPDVVAVTVVSKVPPLTGTPVPVPGLIPTGELHLCADSTTAPLVTAALLDGTQQIGAAVTAGSADVTAMELRVTGIPTDARGPKPPPQAFTSPVALAPVTVRPGGPVIGTVALGSPPFSNLSEACFVLRFGTDRFDVGEELRIDLFGTTLPGLRAVNVGPAAESRRERCVAGYQLAHLAWFTVAGDRPLAITAVTGSVDITEFELRTTGSRDP